VIVSEVRAVIEGLVLCRVGVDRLAVSAHEVTAFELAPEGAPYAGRAFRQAAPAAADEPGLIRKLLRHHDASLAVDSVEVQSERLPLLAVPEVLKAAWGGALTGFVETQGQLWPVVSLERMTRSEP
jgi:hypothetical protein